MIGTAVHQRLFAGRPFHFVFGALLCAALGSIGSSAVANQWIPSNNSKARLVSGTVEVEGKPTVLAGVQLRLDNGWKTYWRYPGDSGVPPSFDWSRSKNLKAAEVLYPAPHRFTDASGTSIGYDEEVTFPVKVVPEREGEPVELELSLDYGLCKDLCIPNEVSLGLDLPPDAIKQKGDALLLEGALALVPKAASKEGLPRIGEIEATLHGPKPALVIDALFPSGASMTDLFLEAGDTFVPVPKPADQPKDGKQRFVVDFSSEAEASAIKGKPLTLTLVSDLGSTETVWTAK
jgi:DsbC/DsbD-like thiol-disulfide interchange protein